MGRMLQSIIIINAGTQQSSQSTLLAVTVMPAVCIHEFVVCRTMYVCIIPRQIKSLTEASRGEEKKMDRE